MSDAFSQEQLAQLDAVVAKAVQRAFADAGLRIDDGEEVDEARKDHSFVRALRLGVNGAAAKIGWTVIAALVGAVIWLVNSGLSVWKGQ